MKFNTKAILLVLLVCLSSCQEKKKTVDSPMKTVAKVEELGVDISRHSWILGKHIQVNVEEGKKNQEAWTRRGENTYEGIAIATVDGKSNVNEVMNLREGQSGLEFVVQHGHNKPMVFQVTEETDTSFTCENKENDFPQKIHYEMRKTGLYALISGGGPEIEYIFRPINAK